MKEYKLIINGNNYNVVINELEDTLAEVEVNGTPYQVTIDKPIKRLLYPPFPAHRVYLLQDLAVAAAPSTGGATHTIHSPLPGVILEVTVKKVILLNRDKNWLYWKP